MEEKIGLEEFQLCRVVNGFASYQAPSIYPVIWLIVNEISCYVTEVKRTTWLRQYNIKDSKIRHGSENEPKMKKHLYN